MTWLTRLPLRYVLPMLLGGFAIVVTGLSYVISRPDVYRAVNRDAVEQMKSSLVQTQGALERLWRSGDMVGVKSQITTFGSDHGNRRTALIDADGLVLASTSLADVGRSARVAFPVFGSENLLDPEKNAHSQVTVVRDRNTTNLNGLIQVCGPGGKGLRLSNCGYLYREVDLKQELDTAVGVLRDQTIRSMLAIVAGTVLLLLLLNSLLMRRAQRLVEVTRAFAAGEADTRSRLQGNDELAEIGQAVDSMLDGIQASQAKLRLRDRAMAESKNGIVISDATLDDLPIIYCNAAFEQMTGYSREQVLGRNCRFLQGDDRDQDGIREAREAVSTGTACQVTLRNYRKDGTLFWNEVLISPVRSPESDITHFIGIQSDITERKRTQALLEENYRSLEQRVEERTAELGESEERYRSLFENSSDLIHSINTDGSFNYVNPAWRQALGYETADVERLNIYDIVHPDDHDYYAQIIKKVFSGLKVTNIQARFVTSHRDFIWIEGNASCQMRDGEPIATRGIFRDVTSRIEAEQRLQEAKETAESATVTKSRFLAAASHDLRQPLQSISIYLAVLKRQLDSPASREISDKMGNSIGIMTEMLNALLDITKLDSGSVVSERQDFAVHSLMQKIVNENLPHAEEKSLELRCVESSHVINSDPALLERIVENFVTNAIRYTESGHVEVRSVGDGDKVRIEVEDTGIGIPADVRDDIFEEYYQVENDVRDRRKGLGLGLSIVKHIARLLEHDLTVQSLPGSGSTFTVTVPMAESVQSTESITDVAVETESSGRKPVVLFVEDDQDVREATMLLFNTCDVIAHSASDGESALRTIGSGVKPDLLVSDYRLPGYDGVELVRRVRAITSDTLPVVLMTGDTAVDQIKSANA